MHDYRKYIGRKIAVMTRSGTFQGVLREVGRETLTLKVTKWFFDDGEDAPTPDGLIILDRYAIDFVQAETD